MPRVEALPRALVLRTGVLRALLERRVMVDYRPGAGIRLAPHFYTTDDELEVAIEAIREIMEFSDQEKEIRVMCDQSSIPKALVDIAVSDPDSIINSPSESECRFHILSGS